MKPTSIALAVSALFGAAHAGTGGPVSPRQDNGLVIITGSSNASIQPRLEINQIYNNHPDQWTLLILALNWWQKESQNSATSYYGVSTIHGVPHQDYNDVAQCQQCSGADGYCPHNSCLFPAWHRTYMALFEQEWLQRVQFIASSFSGSQQTAMLATADIMRWPYWDWAAKPQPGTNVLPDFMTSATVTVTGPDGPMTLDNPLAAYTYSNSSGMYYSPFNIWSTTKRYPNSDSVNAESLEANATAAFNNIQPSLQDQIYQLFTTCTDYRHFSNDVADDSTTGCSNSLEGIHNTVHMTSGGPGENGITGGHMTYLPLAAFDPIFWLHHANVDRFFAMWQTINPDSFGTTQTAVDETWTVAVGTVQDANSPLTPFYKNDNEFYTTNDIRNWSATFGYTYPEFVDSAGDRAAIINYVNALYGPAATAVAGSSKRDSESALSGRSSQLTATNGSTYEYVANIQTPRHFLNGSYTIYLFNGMPRTENPQQWIHDAHLVGTMGVMADTGASMKKHDVLISGSIPLSRSLAGSARRGNFDAVDEAMVIAFLKTNLVWRIAGPDGRSVNPATVPGFAVSVVVAMAHHSGDPSELPAFSPFKTLVSATEGTAGGLNSTTVLRGDHFRPMNFDMPFIPV